MTEPSPRPPSVHFWSPQDLPAEVHDWDPEGEPSRFSDGFGHNVLELYARMRSRGLPVSAGPRALPGSRVVAFLPSLLERRAQLALARELGRRRTCVLVSVRSDFVLDFRLPVRPSLEVMPNQSSVASSHQQWIPPLPQRGLVPRSPDRGREVGVLAYKGFPENLPASMRGPSWTDSLRDVGVEWDADVRDEGTGANRWHDFSRADVALCLRSDGPAVGLLRKPATKLLNAWVAGAVPLVGREPGYLELVRHREDAMVVDSAADVLAVLRELRADPQLVDRLRRGGAARAEEYGGGRVLDRWVSALTGPLPEVPVRTAGAAARTARVAARWALDAARGDSASPIWRQDG